MVDRQVHLFLLLVIIVIWQKRILSISFNGYFLMTHNDHVGLVDAELVLRYLADPYSPVFGFDYMRVVDLLIYYSCLLMHQLDLVVLVCDHYGIEIWKYLK